MTGKELVKRAVRFQGPERIPRDLPESWGTDFLRVSISSDPYWKPKVEGEDEWGCVWQKLTHDKTMGQVKIHPLNNYDMLKAFQFPNYKSPARYNSLSKRIEENKENKFVLAGFPMSLIHRLEYLRGHVEAMTDPYQYPEELCRLLDILTDIAIDSLPYLAKAGVHGIISADDWGLQDRPIMSPAIFCEFFKPRYTRVYEAAHKYGLLTFLHSCGHISALLNDFIDTGLDVIQMDQQENMGLDNLGHQFGGKICFWCPVDIQHTMIYGSLEDIRAYARRLIETFGRFNGGFIAKWYPSPEAVNHSKDRIVAMAEAFVKYGNINERT